MKRTCRSVTRAALAAELDGLRKHLRAQRLGNLVPGRDRGSGDGVGALGRRHPVHVLHCHDHAPLAQEWSLPIDDGARQTAHATPPRREPRASAMTRTTMTKAALALAVTALASITAACSTVVSGVNKVNSDVNATLERSALSRASDIAYNNARNAIAIASAYSRPWQTRPADLSQSVSEERPSVSPFSHLRHCAHECDVAPRVIAGTACACHRLVGRATLRLRHLAVLVRSVRSL